MTRSFTLCLALSLAPFVGQAGDLPQPRQPAIDRTPKGTGHDVVKLEPLPWPDAAPVPPDLPQDFARRVMKPVVLALPGMDAVEYRRNLRYTEVDDANLLLDVYRPSGNPREKRLPAVLFIHGGTDTRARPKDWGVFQSWGRLAAARGLVGVTFTHRLGFPETRVEEGAADVAAALRYITEHASRFGVDPSRVCLFAFSAGGPMLAPYMAEAPAAVRCLVGYYPFMDIRQTEHHGQSETEETRDAYSNIPRLRDPGRKTPMLLVRAGRDEIPTLLDSIDRFVAAALDSGYPLTLTNHPDGPHGFDNEVNDARSREIVLETLEFLKRHLLGSDVHGRMPPDGATGSELAPRLAVFAPFLNKTWKALVDPETQVHDVARWEPALGGQAIRMLHSVGDGAYGGETLVMWDREQEELVYYYFTTAGFYTSGTMSFDDDGRLHSRERVTGNEAGVTEVHATMEILPDGRMKVRTRMLRDGKWEDRGAVIYAEDPAAEVILN